MKLLNHTIKLVALLFLFACSDDDAKPEPNRDLDKNKILSLVNEYRTTGTDCGDEYYPPVQPVQWNNKLELAAQSHSDDMYENDFYSHTGSDGSSPGDRLNRVGYNWSTYGENIYKGETLTEETAIAGWIASPGHCRNIMNGAFRDMAVARTDKYWTQMLGR